MNAAVQFLNASTSGPSFGWMWRSMRSVALIGIAFAAAAMLIEWPRVTMLIWPVPVSALLRLAASQLVDGLMAGLMIGASLECFWWLRNTRRTALQRVFGICAIWLLPMLFTVAFVYLAAAFRSVVFEYGLAGSEQSFYLFFLWRHLTVGLIAVIYLIKKRQIFAEDSRVARAGREWEVARRAVLESRLQAIQARVEPQLLFDALSRMRQSYQASVRAGEQLLEALTDFLRCGLPQMRTATGTIYSECELLKSYALLLRAASFNSPNVKFELDPQAVSMTIATGGLQTLVAPWLRSFPADQEELFEIFARRTGDGIRIVVTGPAADLNLAALATQHTLREIHGARSTVTQRQKEGRLEVCIEYPDDVDEPISMADGAWRAA